MFYDVQGAMKKYSHTWLGFGLLFLLVAVLLAILPSRAALLRDRLRLQRSPAITWTEMPIPAPKVQESAEPRKPEPPREPGSSAPPTKPPAVAPSAPQGAFTLDFGPFATASEADEVENRLNQLGASTVRYRKRSDSALYAVKVGEFGTPAEARERMAELRLRHPTLPLGKLEQDADGSFTIAVDSHFQLREAVALAEQLKAEGFAVRIKKARGAAPLFTLRLATTSDLKTAQEKSRELRNQGLPNTVVPAAPTSSP